MHPPDQAKHNKSSLDANGRLEVIFYDVLCIDQAKNRRRPGSITAGFRRIVPLDHARVNLSRNSVNVAF